VERTADNAPEGAPILVWVRDIETKTGKPTGWRMGRVWKGRDGLPSKLYADGYNGDWDIPYWHPLPEPINE
jgi:hypothetical protein